MNPVPPTFLLARPKSPEYNIKVMQDSFVYGSSVYGVDAQQLDTGVGVVLTRNGVQYGPQFIWEPLYEELLPVEGDLNELLESLDSFKEVLPEITSILSGTLYFA